MLSQMEEPNQSIPSGPYFDDLTVGQLLSPAPPVTIDTGIAAAYQTISGDPLTTALSAPLACAVTGTPGKIVNPALVMQISIGQSTVATKRAIANLFYRGVVLNETIRMGETLHTTVQIRGLREATRHNDRPPRGLILLGIETIRVEDNATVVQYERCAMLRLRHEEIATGHKDNLGEISHEVELNDWSESAPINWDISPLHSLSTVNWAIGETKTDPMRDTVSSALELARLTQNLALIHRDAATNDFNQRLVYGGHTIALAQASLIRLMPGTATVLGWQSCDHNAPVFEDDVLSCRHTLLDQKESNGGQIRAIRTSVNAERKGTDVGTVLDWRYVTWGI